MGGRWGGRGRGQGGCERRIEAFVKIRGVRVDVNEELIRGVRVDVNEELIFL